MTGDSTRGRRRLARPGMSLVEMLVVIAVIAVLAGLLLPAVQSAREAARRARCADHLKQLGLALHAFGQARNAIPPRGTAGDSFSPQTRLLPFLDQGPLYDAINFDLPPMLLLPWEFEPQNETAASRTVGVFLCPSDPNARAIRHGPLSYRANEGTGALEVTTVGRRTVHSYADDGLFFYRSPSVLSAVTDGLSNTLAFAEKPIGSPDRYHPFRDCAEVHAPGFSPGPLSDRWVPICAGLKTVEEENLRAGRVWLEPYTIHSGFLVSVPPNSSTPDCGNCRYWGVYAARSYHPGGVQAVMGDGAVRWFSSGTDASLWRALGTRAGGEVTP